MTRVLAVTGGSCAGKTTLIGELNELLGWDLLSIDAERAAGRDWPGLDRRVRNARRPVIVESIAMPADYRAALARHDTTIMLVTCTEDERQRRLEHRGETRPTGRNYSRSHTHFRVDTTNGVPATTLQALAAMARKRYARKPELDPDKETARP